MVTHAMIRLDNLDRQCIAVNYCGRLALQTCLLSKRLAWDGDIDELVSPGRDQEIDSHVVVRMNFAVTYLPLHGFEKRPDIL
jgi:hypothetical protein